MIHYNPLSFQDRVKNIIALDKSTTYELQQAKLSIGFILLMTDEDRKIHVYVNGRRHIISGQISIGDTAWLTDRLEEINKLLKKKYHIVKVEAFLPFYVLKKLYFPRNFIPKQRDYTRRLFKASRG